MKWKNSCLVTLTSNNAEISAKDHRSYAENILWRLSREIHPLFLVWQWKPHQNVEPVHQKAVAEAVLVLDWQTSAVAQLRTSYYSTCTKDVVLYVLIASLGILSVVGTFIQHMFSPWTQALLRPPQQGRRITELRHYGEVNLAVCSWGRPPNLFNAPHVPHTYEENYCTKTLL